MLASLKEWQQACHIAISDDKYLSLFMAKLFFLMAGTLIIYH
jgi:hypothetical protein